VSVNWLLSEEHIDLETELAWGFLDYLMLGTTAAPLRRALTESGLGESIIGGGLSDELRQPTFSLASRVWTLPMHRRSASCPPNWRFYDGNDFVQRNLLSALLIVCSSSCVV